MASSRRTVKSNRFATVEVSGVDGIRKALGKWLEPELTRELDAANRAAARTYAKELKSALAPVSKHMVKAVRVKRAKTGKPGWVVGSKRKVAFFWPFVIQGTKAHGPRKADALVFIPGWNPYLGASSHGAGRGDGGGGWVRAKKVRGVPANPVVERVAKGSERRVAAQIDKDMTRMTGS